MQTYKINNKVLDLETKNHLMAILNLTPDSFSDGGDFNDMESIKNQVENLINSGATIIDVGGESTRPGATKVDATEEIKRVIPIVKMLKANYNVLISVDTYKSTVAKAAIDAGADIINDVWSNQYDKQMLPLIKKHGVIYIAMHNRNSSDYQNDIISEMTSDFNKLLQDAKKIDLDPNKIILDPGIGFAKDYHQNIYVMQNLAKLRINFYENPFLLGTSRKSFIGKINKLDDPKKRVIGTTVTTTMAINCGCEIIRVHDVEENRQAMEIAQAIYQGRYE